MSSSSHGGPWTALTDPRPGDHLRVPIGNLAWHHGVYLGDGLVAHWHDGREGKDLDDAFWQRKREASIRITPLETFACGRPPEVSLAPAAHPAEEIVARAQSRVGEDGYHLSENNCEHFVRWCRDGRHESLQVRRVEKWISRHGDAAFQIATFAALRKAAPSLLRTGLKGGPVAALASELTGHATRRVIEKVAPERPRLARIGGRIASGAGAALAGLGIAGPAGAVAGAAAWAAGELGSRAALRGTRWLLRTVG